MGGSPHISLHKLDGLQLVRGLTTESEVLLYTVTPKYKSTQTNWRESEKWQYCITLSHILHQNTRPHVWSCLLSSAICSWQPLTEQAGSYAMREWGGMSALVRKWLSCMKARLQAIEKRVQKKETSYLGFFKLEVKAAWEARLLPRHRSPAGLLYILWQ